MSAICNASSGGQDWAAYQNKTFSHLMVTPRELRDKVVTKA